MLILASILLGVPELVSRSQDCFWPFLYWGGNSPPPDRQRRES